MGHAIGISAMVIAAHPWRLLITVDGAYAMAAYAIEAESALFRRAMTRQRRVAMRETL